MDTFAQRPKTLEPLDFPPKKLRKRSCGHKSCNLDKPAKGFTPKVPFFSRRPKSSSKMHNLFFPENDLKLFLWTRKKSFENPVIFFARIPCFSAQSRKRIKKNRCLTECPSIFSAGQIICCFDTPVSLFA